MIDINDFARLVVFIWFSSYIYQKIYHKVTVCKKFVDSMWLTLMILLTWYGIAMSQQPSSAIYQYFVSDSGHGTSVSYQFNPLWPSDAIWQHRFRSALAQVMACCLIAPSHCLNECWLITSEVQWNLPEAILQDNMYNSATTQSKLAWKLFF